MNIVGGAMIPAIDVERSDARIGYGFGSESIIRPSLRKCDDGDARSCAIDGNPPIIIPGN